MLEVLRKFRRRDQADQNSTQQDVALPNVGRSATPTLQTPLTTSAESSNTSVDTSAYTAAVAAAALHAVPTTSPPAPPRCRVPTFSIMRVLLLMGLPLAAAFAIGAVSINHREGKDDMFQSSAFLVEVSSGVEVLATMIMTTLLARAHWTQPHLAQWIMGWLGVVATSGLVSGVYVFLRVRELEVARACDLVLEVEIHECVSGLPTMKAMASLRVLIMGFWILGVVWFALWRRDVRRMTGGNGPV